MAGILLNNSEAPSATNISTGNSATPDAWANVTPGAGGALTTATSSVYRGTQSTRFAPASGVADFLYWSPSNTEVNGAVRFYMFLPIPLNTTSTTSVCSIRTSAGVVKTSINISTSGGIFTVDSAGAGIQSASSALTGNTWYRVEYKFSTGTGTTDSSNFAIYLGDSMTTAFTGSGSSLNLGANNIGRIMFGKCSANSGAQPAMFMDDFAYADGATSFIGPSVGPNGRNMFI